MIWGAKLPPLVFVNGLAGIVTIVRACVFDHNVVQGVLEIGVCLSNADGDVFIFIMQDAIFQSNYTKSTTATKLAPKLLTNV